VPGQYQQHTDGRLDVGIGRAALAPPQVASLLFRQDPLGVLVPSGHRFAGLDAIPVAVLATEPLLLAEEAQAPEFNQFTVEMCRDGGFTPAVHGGTVESIHAAADLVAWGRCLYCVPSSCIAALPGTTWRPLTGPASYYPWSVLWRATETSCQVHAVVSCARAMSQRLGWLAAADPAPAGSGRVSHRARPRSSPIPARPTAYPGSASPPAPQRAAACAAAYGPGVITRRRHRRRQGRTRYRPLQARHPRRQQRDQLTLQPGQRIPGSIPAVWRSQATIIRTA